MKEILLILGACLLIAHPSHAQSASVKMTKIITRDTSPDVPKASFAAKPVTLYRMGESYGRVEEEPDPDHNLQGLVIVSEPKIWIINLRDRTGRSLTDPGPHLGFHAPVLPVDEPGQEQPLKDFEYGREYEFLHANNAARGNEILDGKPYDRLCLTVDGFTVSLFSHAGEERPYRLTVIKGQKLVLQIDYDCYQRDLEPQMTLFEPPKNIQIVETNES